MNFTVYKSSAGSGKTFTLVMEYLKIALKNNKADNYRGILAITFTNKATSEMKERILGALTAFSSEKKLSTNHLILQKQLLEELGIKENELHTRASRTLTHILHHYSDFSISTIDKFVYRVVKSFARDLNIPLNAEVDLETDHLLRNAVNQLIASAGTDPFLTRILIEFTEQKTADEKSWDIENDLFLFAKEMLKEDSLAHLEKLRSIPLSEFLKIKEELSAKIKTFETEIISIGKEALQRIESAGISPSSFAGGKNGLPKYFSYLAECRTDKLNPSSTVLKVFQNDQWHAAKPTGRDYEKINAIKDELTSFYSNAIQFIEKNGKHYFLVRLVLQNIYSLAVLRELEIIFETLKKEKNIIHISEFNKRIAGIVSSESAPFIYERIGEKYRHFLIDEFQDTSSLQWMNLLPLVHNSLSEGNFNMIVGDGKQAIYRWRSGDVEQFARLPYLANKTSTPMESERERSLIANHKPEILKNNFRSKKEIVEFNNFFFGELSLLLDNEYRGIYHQQEQLFKPENTGGHVSINVFREEPGIDLRQKNLDRILEIVQLSLSENYRLNDLCILCRKNADASEIAGFLLKNNIPVVSSESLLLKHSPEVRFLISLLHFLNDPSDKKHAIAIAGFLIANKLTTLNLHQQFNAIMEADTGYFLQFLNNAGFSFNTSGLQKASIYELVENLVRIFSLQKSSNISYLAFFLELVHTFSTRDSVNLAAFLEYWEQKKDAASVILPEGLQAVRIMTIHKAKGLEFPVVIFPFANWKEKLTKDFFWLKPEEQLQNLPSALVTVKKDLEHTDFAGIYTQEKNKSLLDQFNLIYVAFTRARERLYVLSSIEKQKTFSKHYIEVLKKHPLWNEETHTLKTGNKENTENRGSLSALTTDNQSRDLIFNEWRDKVHIRNNFSKYKDAEKKKNYGKMLHYALSFVKTPLDVGDALEKLLASGTCSEEEKKGIAEKIVHILNNPEIKPFFSGDFIIRNEAEILLPGGDVYRPDRVMSSSHKAIVIDYKSGTPTEKDRIQVIKYGQAIAEIEKKEVEMYLLYTEQEKIIRVE